MGEEPVRLERALNATVDFPPRRRKAKGMFVSGPGHLTLGRMPIHVLQGAFKLCGYLGPCCRGLVELAVFQNLLGNAAGSGS